MGSDKANGADLGELEAIFREAKANAPYLRARSEIHALRRLPDDAPPAAKMRALGSVFAALADALDDTEPSFEPQRGRLREFASAAGIVIKAMRKQDQKIGQQHVVDMLTGVRQAHRDALDGFCTPRECLAKVIDWLTANGYERAAAHVARERAKVEEAIRAPDATAFNKAVHGLLKAGGFAPMTLGSLKSTNSLRWTSRKSKAAQ